jgi:hypothetical protein
MGFLREWNCSPLVLWTESCHIAGFFCMPKEAAFKMQTAKQFYTPSKSAPRSCTWKDRLSSSLPKLTLRYMTAQERSDDHPFLTERASHCLGLATSKDDLDAIEAVVATGKTLETPEGHSDRVSVRHHNGEGTIDARGPFQIGFT